MRIHEEWQRVLIIPFPVDRYSRTRLGREGGREGRRRGRPWSDFLPGNSYGETIASAPRQNGQFEAVLSGDSKTLDRARWAIKKRKIFGERAALFDCIRFRIDAGWIAVNQRVRERTDNSIRANRDPLVRDLVKTIIKLLINSLIFLHLQEEAISTCAILVWRKQKKMVVAQNWRQILF